MQFTWVDCETGEKDVNLFGANGQNDWDKGVGSALTYAERYFLLKYFNIATDEDDIDNDQRKTSAPIEATKSIVQLDIPRLETRLNASKSLEELGKVYLSFTAAEKQVTEKLKNELKQKLTLIPA